MMVAAIPNMISVFGIDIMLAYHFSENSA